MSANLQNQISELKVSGHTMALDPGLYCLFSAPGSPAPALDTGLPTVRISAAPGGAAGGVDIVGLNANGWIGPDAATLVRISGARSNVLVTVYQANDSRADAPALQVVRISGPAETAAVAQATPVAQAKPPEGSDRKAADRAEMSVVAHIYGRGDVGGQIGDWMGDAGSKRWIEGFGIAPIEGIPASDIEYQAVLGRGWLSPWSQGGQFCGSRSMSLPILGLRIRLRGGSAGTHRISLSATFIDGSKVGPVGDGEPCEAPSLAALESFRVGIEAVGAVAVAPRADVGKDRSKKPVKIARSAAAKAVPASAPAQNVAMKAPVATRPAKVAAKAPSPAIPIVAVKRAARSASSLKPAGPAPVEPKSRTPRIAAPGRRR